MVGRKEVSRAKIKREDSGLFPEVCAVRWEMQSQLSD